MKPDIHPSYSDITVTCRNCKAEYPMRSTLENDSLLIDSCSNCHPFYTGKQKTVEAGGQVQRFYQRYKDQLFEEDEDEDEK